MTQFNYKGRIHRNKLSMRSLRYALADQLVRLYPPLQERWLFPAEAAYHREVAELVECYPMNVVTKAPPPAVAWLTDGYKLGRDSNQYACTIRNATVTGQAGGVITGGRFVASQAKPNWAIALRPRQHKVRTLPDDRIYYNLLSPRPAIGHIYHWLFDHIAWATVWLSRRQSSDPVSLLINAGATEFQRKTIQFLCERFSLGEPIALAANEAVTVERLVTSIVEPWDPTAINASDDTAMLTQLGEFIRRDAAPSGRPKRFYVTRNDARLRRVVNEEALLPILARRGVERVTLTGMPISEQVALFMDAEVIVAAHGAGLAHISWCKPGTHLIEFIPSPHGKLGKFRGTAAFWIIACQRGLKYQGCEGGVKLNKHDYFEIPSGALEASLERISADQ
jgi:hypothetical protein